MVKTREDYEPTVTGILDGSEGVIVDAYLGPNPRPEYRAVAGDSPGLTLIIESPGLERPVEQWYSVGGIDAWGISKDGQAIVNIKKPDVHRFNKNSRAWDLVEAIAIAIGEGDKGKGQDFFIKRGPNMTEAKFYIGLNFVWEQKTLSTVGDGKSNIPLPTKFLGEVSSVKSVAKASAAVTEAPPEEVIAKILALAPGKDAKGLKQAVLAARKSGEIEVTDTLMRELVSGPLLANLEKDGKLMVDSDGSYLVP